MTIFLERCEQSKVEDDQDIEELGGGSIVPYKTIIDPVTRAMYSLNSREGKKLLKRLAKVIMNTKIIDPQNEKELCVYSEEGMKVLKSYLINMDM